jgi:hypothetical protein
LLGWLSGTRFDERNRRAKVGPASVQGRVDNGGTARSVLKRYLDFG